MEALTKPKNAIIQQYIKMLALDGIELIFDEKALEQIAEKAIVLQTGARGLRTVVEETMRDIMYSIPSEKNLSKVIITTETVNRTGKATLEYLEAQDEIELEPLPTKPARGKTALD
jgi:ATP-dependent Clp protease ATP-binding subunit ClpX